jgi:AcrR family transcriptional regulator
VPDHGTSGIEYPRYSTTASTSTTDTPQSRPEGPIPRVPRDEVRRRLLAAAAKSFAERGYEDSRLEDIANAAGFTKGAVYSNFSGKQELFGAILGAGAESEFNLVMTQIRDSDNPAEAVGPAVRTVARRIVGDAERGQLRLGFAARAARDNRTREILTPLRRAQRAAASRTLTACAERTGADLAVSPDLAALIVHCLCNGLSNERIADPEAIDVDTVERALSAVLAALIAPHTDSGTSDTAKDM